MRSGVSCTKIIFMNSTFSWTQVASSCWWLYNRSVTSGSIRSGVFCTKIISVFFWLYNRSLKNCSKRSSVSCIKIILFFCWTYNRSLWSDKESPYLETSWSLNYIWRTLYSMLVYPHDLSFFWSHRSSWIVCSGSQARSNLCIESSREDSAATDMF